jgi:hypothetical protein
MLILVILSSCKETAKVDRELLKEGKHEGMTKTETIAKKSISPHTSAMAMIGDAHIHIDYSSPGVRERIIFGGLLPYNQVWQAGAHMATWLETNRSLTINGKKLPAGKYGLFAIPSKKEWTIIFNTNWDQHGKDEYDEKKDILRFMVKPNFSEDIKEHLEYTITAINETSGIIKLNWEKITLEFSFEVN